MKLTDVPDEYLADTLVVAKKIAIALGIENFNLLQVRIQTSYALAKRRPSDRSLCNQNNGKIAFQVSPSFRCQDSASRLTFTSFPAACRPRPLPPYPEAEREKGPLHLRRERKLAEGTSFYGGAREGA